MSRIQHTPSKEEIEVAREYLEERLEAERSMQTNLRKVMDRAAALIVSIAYSYNVSPENFSFSRNRAMQAEIDEVIADLMDDVEDFADTLATYRHEDESDEIIAYIHRENHGKTFDERLKDYAQKYKNELEIGIIAALYLKKSQSVTLSAIKNNMEHPYRNPLIAQAIKAGRQIELPNYGRGRTNAMLTAMLNLTSFAVAEGWMHALWLNARKGDAIGFVTFRNSSVPCDICDDYAGWLHPMDDPLPPLHSHCVCGAVFVYAGY